MTINLRIWGIASGAAAVAVLAGGWFLGVQPQLAAAATAAESAVNVDAQNQATMMKVASLSKAAAKLDEMKTEDTVLQKSVPSILKPNTFIRRVTELATLDGVDIVSISPGDAVAYTAPAATSASGSSASGGAAAVALAQVNPLITTTNFSYVPVTVVVTGGADATLQFAHDLQNDQRTFAINGIQSSQNDNSSAMSTSINGYIYVLKR